MKAMLLRKCVDLQAEVEPLELVDLPKPKPKAKEVLLKVKACGICHTELDEIEGRAAPPVFPVIPGHQVVGIVEQLGPQVTRLAVGDRVGVGWIFSSTGKRDENISNEFKATGLDVNGGYAEYMTVGEDYAYAIPDVYSDVQAAPLLCAGAIGYRALNLTQMADGDALGLTGFGASAHLVLQLVKYRYPASQVFVFARSEREREFAIELGADWAGDTSDRAPCPLRAMIDTTPAWKPVIEALANLAPGGRLVINAIRKEDRDKDELLRLSYQEHLWLEREIKTVANITQYDLREFLSLAGEIPLQPDVTTYPLDSANVALHDLQRGDAKGAKVLLM